MTTRLVETSSGTPLISLSAVSFDTETTGLDVRHARIIQIGAVRIDKGRIDEGATFETFVDPQEAIPPASTRVHRISDADVTGADTFPPAFNAFRNWTSDTILLGYSTGFDLAMFKAEADRAGLSWSPPRSLDVRHLVQLLAPPLPDQALDTVASWLGQETDARHNALADAVLTAQVFLALVPHLRDKGIRTLAEAETACRMLSSQMSDEAKAGWLEVVRSAEAQQDSVTALARIDSFPYRHRICDIMTSPPAAVDPQTSLRDVLSLLMHEKISSVFVRAESSGKPDGIITERDLLRLIDADPDNALARSAGEVAIRPLIAVTETDYAYRAISRLKIDRLRHLAVVDAAGSLVGAVTSRDLLGQRAGDSISMGDEIEHAQSPEDLGTVWAKLSMIALGLISEEVDPRDIATIISNELRGLTRQACVIAERELLEAGKGAPPTPYAMIVLGSGGRGESLLAMDQDNAIVYQEGDPGGPEDQWLKALGQRVSDILNAVGVVYCKGGIMAANAEWRMSMNAWRASISGWIGRSKPEDILHTDIFFDSSPVHGERELANIIRDEALKLAAGSKNFLQLLAHNASDVDVPLGWFGRFQLKEGRVDLKMGGIMPIFSAARVLALRHQISARATPERLEAARPHMPDEVHILNNLIDAHKVILGAILEQQLRDIDRGVPPGNAVAPKELSGANLDALKWAVEQVRNVKLLLGNPMIFG